MNECIVELCTRAAHAHGLCGGHYLREREGKALRPLRRKRTRRDDPIEHFWSRADKRSACWIWTGALTEGYGAVHWEGRKRGAHVIAYELTYGPLPAGMVPDHRCRNRACVNPEHLRPATHKQNAENKGPQSNNASGYRGVRKDRTGKRWLASARHHGIEHRVPGSFATPEEANVAAIELRSRLFTHAEEHVDV